MVGLASIVREVWNTATNTEDKREKLQALSLAKECYSMKLDLLTNATLVDDAIRFVAEKSCNLKDNNVSIQQEENERHEGTTTNEVS
jgi:hypothetical protein